MWSALAGALIPVALGVGVALTPWFRGGLLRPARLLAVGAVFAVVLLELLPRAVASLGPIAIVVFLVALLGPVLLERLAHRLGSRAETDLTVEVAFGLLLFHQVVDGLEVGAAHAVGTAPWPVTLAIGAHSAPFVAAIILGVAQRRGPRPAMLRGLSLLIATGVGAVAGSLAPAGLVHEAGWLPAVVGGVLLHVVWHDLGPGHDHGGHGHGHEHDHDGHAH